jgi:hypothetical protein
VNGAKGKKGESERQGRANRRKGERRMVPLGTSSWCAGDHAACVPLSCPRSLCRTGPLRIGWLPGRGRARAAARTIPAGVRTVGGRIQSSHEAFYHGDDCIAYNTSKPNAAEDGRKTRSAPAAYGRCEARGLLDSIAVTDVANSSFAARLQ